MAKHRERCELDTRSAMEASLAKFMGKNWGKIKNSIFFWQILAFTGQPASLVDNPTFVDFLRHYELHWLGAKIGGKFFGF